MIITAVKPFAIRAHRPFTFVKIETDEGLYGIGEAGVTWRERAQVEMIHHLAPLLVGQDPMRTEHLWQLMFRGGFFPTGHVGSAALSAIDIALWDLKGKALGQPVYNLLGGLCRDKVVVYPHNVGDTTEALVANCLAHQQAGWKFLRWGQPETGPGRFEPARSVRMAIEQFAAIRAAVGPEMELCFDVHTRLDPPDALRLCREVERFHPFFIEDPLRSEDPAAYRAFTPKVQVPLAIGEQWHHKWQFRPLIEEDLMQYARIDLCIVGGITEAVKIARWCETHFINLAPHNPLGPVSAAAGLHLCLASTNVGVLELPRKPSSTLTDLFPQQLSWEDGYVLAPTAPGLGVELNEDAIANYPYDERGTSPRLTRDDGAFTNW